MTAGARVVLADRDEESVIDVARQLGPLAEGIGLDVRDAAAVDAAISGVWKKHGRLDYLFNNAGTGVGGEVKDYDLDDWRYVVDVNLMGVIHGVQAAYPRMIEQGFGHIVNTASMAGLCPTPGVTGVLYDQARGGRLISFPADRSQAPWRSSECALPWGHSNSASGQRWQARTRQSVGTDRKTDRDVGTPQTNGPRSVRRQGAPTHCARTICYRGAVVVALHLVDDSIEPRLQ